MGLIGWMVGTSSVKDDDDAGTDLSLYPNPTNGDDLKDFIKAKDEEMLYQQQSQSSTTLTIVPVLNNNEAIDDNGVVKQVVRKRAPIFPFEPEDHYIPDNNSNNIIPKEEIVPAPTAIERKQGYCLRPFRETGQQRYICTVCGKHYTTMYNMRQHRNIHTGSGLHCCRYCGRSFTHKHVWEVSYNFNFTKKLRFFCWKKIRENTTALHYLAIDNFDFTKKI